MKVLTDLLWILDGHHDTLKALSCPLPPIFCDFTGYNVPQCSKHLKWKNGNLSANLLNPFLAPSLAFYKKTIGSSNHVRTSTRKWSCLLAVSLNTKYLDQQSKNVTLRHASDIPVWSISASISVSYVKATSSSLFHSFRKLDIVLEEMAEYQHVFLNDLIPSDPKKRYNFLQSLLRTDVRSPIIVCRHSTGKSVGNMHLVWRVPYKDGAEMVFGECQHVIERIRPSFLTFHTQAMHKAMFSNFCSIYPTIKPSVLCYFYRYLTGVASAASDTGEVEIDERIF